jgi:hypothetical protein
MVPYPPGALQLGRTLGMQKMTPAILMLFPTS